MSRLTIVTGGCRSGKSREAMKRALAVEGPRWFVATAYRGDPELDARIDRHRAERERAGFEGTLEASVDLAQAISGLPKASVTLIDCATIWLSNLMLATPDFGEPQAAEHAEHLARACRELPGDVIVVTNEVGYGVVPDWELGRRFRDCLGRANQILAEHADTAILVVCGLPITLKGSP